MKKTISKGTTKPQKMKEDKLYIAGLITKGKDKGKYIALEVRNSMMLNPVEPIFQTNPEIEYMVVSKDEKKLRTIFGRIVKMATDDKLIKVN